MKFKHTILILFAFLEISLFAQNSYTIKTVPNPKNETSNNFVSNPDQILSSTVEAEINSITNSLESHNGVEIAVVLLNSIGAEDIKDFAIDLFEYWGIGKEGADNGILILFVKDQRSITFETGYGIEGDLPDALCKRIQKDYMIPYFKEGNYNDGILDGVKATADVLRTGKYEFEVKAKMSPFLRFTLIAWGGIFHNYWVYLWLSNIEIST